MQSSSISVKTVRFFRILAVAAALVVAAGCQMAFSPLEVSWYDEDAFLEGSAEEVQSTQGEDLRDEEPTGEEETAVDPDVPGEPDAASSVRITLAWDANAEPSVAGYRLHYGTRSGEYTATIEAGASTEVTIEDLTPGQTYYFAVTAYDSEGDESEYSDEVSYEA